MSDGNSDGGLNRRSVLRGTSMTIGAGAVTALSRPATASKNGRERGGRHRCGAAGEPCGKIQELSRDGDSVVTLVEVLGEKFLFREAMAYRNAENASRLREDVAYEATETGHPVEYKRIDTSGGTTELTSSGSVSTQDVEFTPENFIEYYDVDFKRTCTGCCGDIAWNSHYALEFHI
ncbi:MAG: hypothetical protein ABEJ42_03195 [Halobacteriaceae archaeon]